MSMVLKRNAKAFSLIMVSSISAFATAVTKWFFGISQKQLELATSKFTTMELNSVGYVQPSVKPPIVNFDRKWRHRLLPVKFPCQSINQSINHTKPVTPRRRVLGYPDRCLRCDSCPSTSVSVLCNAEQWWHRVSIEGRPLCNLRFADDIDLLGSSEEELQHLLKDWRKQRLQYGMEISSESATRQQHQAKTTTYRWMDKRSKNCTSSQVSTQTKDGTSVKEVKIRPSHKHTQPWQDWQYTVKNKAISFPIKSITCTSCRCSYVIPGRWRLIWTRKCGSSGPAVIYRAHYKNGWRRFSRKLIWRYQPQIYTSVAYQKVSIHPRRKWRDQLHFPIGCKSRSYYCCSHRLHRRKMTFLIKSRKLL